MASTYSHYVKTHKWSSCIALLLAALSLYVLFEPGDLMDGTRIGRLAPEARILAAVVCGMLCIRLGLDAANGSRKTRELIEEICSNRRWLTALFVLTLIFFTWVKLSQHYSFRTGAADLSIYDYAVYNTANGRFMETIILGRNYFAEHFAPILLALVPFYWLTDSATILVVSQAVVLVAAIVPLYFLARDVLNNATFAVVVVVLFLIFGHTIDALMFDFHMEIFEPLFIFSAFLFLHRKQYRRYLLFALLAMTCKEDISLYFIPVGLYVWLVERNRVYGIATMVLGATWLLVAMEVVIPLSFEGAPQQSRFLQERWGDYGSTSTEIVFTMVTQPWRLLGGHFPGNVLRYFGRFGFAGFASPLTALLSLPILLLNSSAQVTSQARLHIHYGLPLIPFVFVATIYGLANIKSRLSSGAWQGFALFYCLFTIGLNAYYIPVSPITADDREGHALLAQLPEDSAVAAQTSLLPHITKREQICLLPDGGNAEYVLFDVERLRYPMNERYDAVLASYLDSAEFTLITDSPRYFFFKRRTPPPEPTGDWQCERFE